ncbi:putative CAMK family protein kinase [Tritrichomonas foetus]|uniref:CAMK family protein kinase n=1 Tax=Tritrichomonas foetus TaxID=1144522 RepID=A0A1J4JUM4_9EUKA|nr:putative CAMK family protein kinase [Tritrichomonas foetus]|eukprot:OHT02841.1 putative CAMK family protein kinase [Tritrichomonas foetus]
MPDFHPNIKDLIGRMMTVDPSQRITMEQIKNHPAFRFGLPITYVVPKPVPFPDFCAPMDPSILSADMIHSLTKIGLQQEEIKYEMMSNESNPVKIFVMLLSRHIQITELPWEHAIRHLRVDDYDPGIDSSIDQLNNQFNNNQFNNVLNANVPVQNLPNRSKGPIQDISSPEGFSLASRPDWATFTSGMRIVDFDVDENFGPVMTSLWVLMNAVEQILINCGFIFFHPNDLMIYGKNENDAYAIVEAIFTSQESLLLHLQLRNATPEERDNLCRALSEISALSL